MRKATECAFQVVYIFMLEFMNFRSFKILFYMKHDISTLELMIL